MWRQNDPFKHIITLGFIAFDSTSQEFRLSRSSVASLCE